MKDEGIAMSVRNVRAAWEVLLTDMIWWECKSKKMLAVHKQPTLYCMVGNFGGESILEDWRF